MVNTSFNNRHPELSGGEVFLKNVRHSENADEWNSVPWSTKRLGWTAYDDQGNIIPGMRPVFVQRKQLERNGLDPDRL